MPRPPPRSWAPPLRGPPRLSVLARMLRSAQPRPEPWLVPPRVWPLPSAPGLARAPRPVRRLTGQDCLKRRRRPIPEKHVGSATDGSWLHLTACDRWLLTAPAVSIEVWRATSRYAWPGITDSTIARDASVNDRGDRASVAAGGVLVGTRSAFDLRRTARGNSGFAQRGTIASRG